MVPYHTKGFPSLMLSSKVLSKLITKGREIRFDYGSQQPIRGLEGKKLKLGNLRLRGVWFIMVLRLQQKTASTWKRARRFLRSFLNNSYAKQQVCSSKKSGLRCNVLFQIRQIHGAAIDLCGVFQSCQDSSCRGTR